jgi:hypothetical protein
MWIPLTEGFIVRYSSRDQTPSSWRGIQVERIESTATKEFLPRAHQAIAL